MTEYHNSLDGPTMLHDWVAEGPVSIEQGPSGVVLSSSWRTDQVKDQDCDPAHWTLWCPIRFDDDIRIEWQFRPISEPGLAMLFFAATGHSGELFSPAQAARDGHYPQYHSGDLDALHVSYFRHKWPKERAFRTCNLRKSAGFHLVAQGADPLPPSEDADGFYRLAIEKRGPDVAFSINELSVFDWHDDGRVGGRPLRGGHVGLRQMAPLVAEYRNFSVTALPASSPGPASTPLPAVTRLPAPTPLPGESHA